jgi:hypothetical protein
MSDQKVIYNGVRMSAGWPARIEEAQEATQYAIGGEAYDRIPYGRERGSPVPPGPCHDCAVLPAQLHVPFICDMEECPSCHGQVIACDCPYDSDEPDDTAAEDVRSEPAVDWRSLLERVLPAIGSRTVFLELADGRFARSTPEPRPGDVVALAITWADEGLTAWDTEAPARRLAEELSARPGLEACMLLNRDPDSFVGYYVRVRPA